MLFSLPGYKCFDEKLTDVLLYIKVPNPTLQTDQSVPHWDKPDMIKLPFIYPYR